VKIIKEQERQDMKVYGFEVAHGYQILKGIVKAESEEQAKVKILNQDWEDIIDEFDVDELTEDYEVLSIWE